MRYGNSRLSAVAKDGKVQYAQTIEIPDRIRQEKLQAIVVGLSKDVA